MTPDEVPAYHTLFVRVEYDPEYTGGDYSGAGRFVLLPAVLVAGFGMRAAFAYVTKLDPVHVVHWCPGELYAADGRPVTDYRYEFGPLAPGGPA